MIRTTDRNDFCLNFALREVGRAWKASAVAVNAFDSLEKDVLEALSSMFPRIYPIGPLNLLLHQACPENDHQIMEIQGSLWGEDAEFLLWLDSKKQKSVIYVSFGSEAFTTPQQLVEFAWGLADSEQNFPWVIRLSTVMGDPAHLPPEFKAEIIERGLVVEWAPQEEILRRPPVGGFLTHGGWNSVLESACSGVPMLCWTFGSDQPTNCQYCCTE